MIFIFTNCTYELSAKIMDFATVYKAYEIKILLKTC